MVYLPAKERRAQVVAAAARVIARVGIEQATTRLIAAEADAPLASIHYVFGGKRELVAAVYEFWYATTVEQLKARNLETADLAGCIEVLVIGFFEDMINDEASMQLPYELFFWATRNIEDNDLAARIYREYREFYAGALRRAEPNLTYEAARSVAQFIVHTGDGVLLHYFAERDVEAARASLRLYCQVALQLARARSGSGADRVGSASG